MIRVTFEFADSGELIQFLQGRDAKAPVVEEAKTRDYSKLRRRKWGADEVKFVLENYATKKAGWIGHRLNRSAMAIHQLAFNLRKKGLVLEPKYNRHGKVVTVKQ